MKLIFSMEKSALLEEILSINKLSQKLFNLKMRN